MGVRRRSFSDQTGVGPVRQGAGSGSKAFKSSADVLPVARQWLQHINVSKHVLNRQIIPTGRNFIILHINFHAPAPIYPYGCDPVVTPLVHLPVCVCFFFCFCCLWTTFSLKWFVVVCVLLFFNLSWKRQDWVRSLRLWSENISWNTRFMVFARLDA